MNNQLQLIDEREILDKVFRAYGTPEEPLFLAKDVAEWIENKNASQMVKSAELGLDEKGIYSIDTLGGNQELLFLTEDGVYEVLMQSRKPIAKQFKKKVKEILKTIRKTGGYINNSNLLVETYFGALPTEQKQMVKALMTNIEEQQKQILTMRPKAEYFDALVDRDLLTNFRDTAKELGIGQKHFINYLLENKYIYRDSKRKLKPYMKYVPKLFKLKEWQNNSKADVQTLITPEGREKFKSMLVSKIA